MTGSDDLDDFDGLDDDRVIDLGETYPEGPIRSRLREAWDRIRYPIPRHLLGNEGIPAATEACLACLDRGSIDDNCPMCGGEGYVDQLVDVDLLTVWDADPDEEYPR
jgi:hypothetical protein